MRVLVTHDPVEAMTVADRIVVMERGEITQRGTPEELRNAPRTPYVADLVGVNLFAGRLEPLDDGAGRIVTDDGAVVVPGPTISAANPPTACSARFARPTWCCIPPSRRAPRATRSHGRSPRSRSRASALASARRAPPVVAEVTLRLRRRLGLREGATVWASFKAVEVVVVLPYDTGSAPSLGLGRTVTGTLDR